MEEGSKFELTCGIQPGNPESTTALTWKFVPKYLGHQSQALPGQAEGTALTIKRVLYTDAGT